MTIRDFRATERAEELRMAREEELAPALAEIDRHVEVELDDGPPCPACGAIGPHYCTGGQRHSTVYVGVRKHSS